MSKRNRDRRRKKTGYQPGVLEQIARAEAEGRLQPGQVFMVDVRHDHWCALIGGKGPCNCNPEVFPPRRVQATDEN